jgi:hypothetical protein
MLLISRFLFVKIFLFVNNNNRIYTLFAFMNYLLGNRKSITSLRIENYGAKRIFLLLSTFFLLFYFVQIPFWTSNSDVLVYCSRATSGSPITKYTYLDERSLILVGNEPVPNYHMGHTALLWLVYYFTPESLSKTIWPAGFVSAISGALIVGLTFLIWLKLGFKKKQALSISIFAGLVPTIWYHSLIGEVNSLQFLFILFFLYFFLHDSLFLSTISFLIANLVTPLSGLCFPLILLDFKKEKFLIKAAVVGASALILYAIIFLYLEINIIKGFATLHPSETGRSFAWKIYKLGTFLLINLNFFIFYFIRGSYFTIEKYKKVSILLLLATIPYFLLSFKLIMELGSHQLTIFWALSFPIGLFIVTKYVSCRYIILSFFGLALTFLFVWYIPSIQVAKARYFAGKWLSSYSTEELPIVGDWDTTVGVVLGRYNFSYEKLLKKYVLKYHLNEEDLKNIKQKSFIFVCANKPKLRKYLEKLGVIKKDEINIEPGKKLKNCSVQKIYENRWFRFYRFDLEDSSLKKSPMSDVARSKKTGSSYATLSFN